MEPLAQAVERLGQVLEDSGVPRMPARVFAYILAEDRDRYTAAELAEGLQVSPAAISGAVRYLTQTRLVVRERRPSGRGDLYRVVDGDIWGTIMTARLPLLDHYITSLEEAVTLLEPGSPGRARVEETRDYFTFAREGLSDLADRWAKYHAETRR
ncbi:MAG: GbsR/MarR family transcriptional regulator [Nocardioidaceae bacterium]|nr:MarR family transcriptional regulator [Nocardioidaceae bacterium]